jgi:hypothetical protein
MPYHTALIAAGRLDADATDAGLGQLAVKTRHPANALATCQCPVRPSIATSSLLLEVSIPAVVVLVCVILVDPAL